MSLSVSLYIQTTKLRKKSNSMLTILIKSFQNLHERRREIFKKKKIQLQETQEGTL